MPTIVGILTFMSWINFVLSCVKHENSFITLGLMTDHPCLKTDVSDDGVLCITCYSAQHFKIFLFGNMKKDLNGTYKKAIVPICKNRILDFWDCFEKEKSVLTKPFSCPNVIFMQFASNPPSSSWDMGCVTTKPVYGLSDKVIFTLACSATETS